MGIRGILLVHGVLLLAGLTVCLILMISRRRLGGGLALLVTPCVMWLWYQATRLDQVRSVFYPEDTVYAAAFSESAFQSLSIAVDKTTVMRLLGQPLQRRVEGGREYWHYTGHGPRFKNYWNRIVIFDVKQGVVVKKFAEFYTD